MFYIQSMVSVNTSEATTESVTAQRPVVYFRVHFLQRLTDEGRDGLARSRTDIGLQG